MSDSGDHVFRVPLWDVAAQRSATGGYPWYIEGDSSTLVYIKNVTDQPRKFRLYLMFGSGAYLYPLTTVASGQTTTIDIRALRDNQVTDADGRTIPLTETRGQVQWSMTGGEDRVLIGRSEQADLVKDISSNYACLNCCGNSFYAGWVTPDEVGGFAGDQMQLLAMQQDANCYGQAFQPYPTSSSFSSFAPSICQSTFGGLTTAVGAGDTWIQGGWTADSWFMGLNEQCEYTPLDILREALCEVTDATVAKIQYQASSGYVDVSGTLFVLKGTSVTFKAVPNPANGQFSSGKPVWSGSSGASGTGQTTSVTFNTVSSSTSDFKTVIATSGNAVTANVVVFELTPQLTPSDNFSGRSLERFGVHEVLTLGFTTTPSGVTAAQTGGLQWQQINGAGSLEDAGTDGTATYFVANAAGSAALKLKILDGPSKDSGPTKSITVVAPSDGYVLKQPLSGIKHIYNRWSCGFIGDIFVLPDDVSFFNLYFKEEEIGGAANGWLSFLDGIGHCLNGVCPSAVILNGNSGGRVNGDDAIFSGSYSSQDHGSYATGSVTWAIPWKYAITFGSWQSIISANQTATSSSTGRCTITKRGSGTYARELGAPTEDW